MRMSTNTFSQTRVSIAPFIFLFTVSTVAWSFNFTSFNHAKELILLVGAVFSAFFFLRSKIRYSSNLFICGIFLFFCLYGILQSLVAPASFTPESILSWATLCFFFFLIFLICSALEKEQIRELITQLLVVSSIVISVLALVQKFGIARFLFPIVEGYTQPMYSVFGNQNLLGGYLAVSFPVLLLKCIQTPSKKYFLVLVTVVLFALLLSESRTAWFASAVGVATVFLCNKRSMTKVTYIFLGTIGLLCVLIPILSVSMYQKIVHTGTVEDVSFGLRQWIWAGSFSMWKEFAIGGTGLGNFAYHSPNFLGQVLAAAAPGQYTFNQIHTWHAHSDYLETVINFGLVGFLVIGVAFRALIKTSNDLKPPFLVMAIFSIFNSTLHSPPFAVLWLLFIFCAFSERRTVQHTLVLNSTLYSIIVLLCFFIAFSSLWPSYLLNRARVSFENGEDISVVVDSYKTAADYWSAPPETHMEWAILEIQEKQFENSFTILDKIGSRIDTGEWHYAMGVSLEESGSPSKAVEHYRETIKRWPRFRPAWERLIPLIPDEEKADLQRQYDVWFNEPTE